MAATCCARLSKLYMIVTNTLFACLGVAFIAFGVIGNRNGFRGADLFPSNVFKQIPILGAIILVSALLGIVAAFVKRRFLMYIYLVLVLIALVFQVVIGVQIYRKVADTPAYLGPMWSKASVQFREQLQTEFKCCGYNTARDNPAVTDRCNPNGDIISPDPPCYGALNDMMHTSFSRLYIALFAALAVEVLAFSNAVTVLCSRSIHGDDEEERRKRRKSGIRLDDMSPDTPTTAGSHNQYNGSRGDINNYYAGGYKEDSRSTLSGRDNRYDSYDIYRQNNSSNAQQARYY